MVLIILQMAKLPTGGELEVDDIIVNEIIALIRLLREQPNNLDIRGEQSHSLLEAHLIPSIDQPLPAAQIYTAIILRDARTIRIYLNCLRSRAKEFTATLLFDVTSHNASSLG